MVLRALLLLALPAVCWGQPTDFYAGLTVQQGTLTTSQPGLAISQTWNNGSVIFRGLTVDVTDLSSATGSEVADFRLGGATQGKITATGQVVARETGGLVINHRMIMQSAAPGRVRFNDESGNDWDCLDLGGNTSGHPALCRSNVVPSFLEARTAEVGMTAYTSILGRGWVSVGGLSNFSDASQPSAAILNPSANFIQVTGSTDITGIGTSGVQPGTCIVLEFADGLTMVDGGNLRLAGDFTATPDDTWTGCLHGGVWYETSRAVN